MSEPLYCVNHSTTETYLRCNRCGQPICPKCAVQTPVGYRCRDCINVQQKVFYADFRPADYVIAAIVTLPLALIAGWILPRLGWYTIILGPITGGGIAEVARWAIRRRRGRHTWIVVCACIVVGALPQLLLSLLFIVGSPEMIVSAFGSILRLLWFGVYLVTAAGAAYARLRPGRRM
ncbi:MAG: hypothetical protein GY832_07380 [Chloroflexi bacterium]|nr:hypothetical protein [Chloroflexota bacterium]